MESANGGVVVESKKAQATEPVAQQPAVQEKKKRKTSKELKDAQRFERAVTKAERRIAKAVMMGLDSWQKNRDKKAFKKKDGALKYAMVNASRAVGKMMEEASKSGDDFSRTMKPMLGKKTEKRIVRAMRGFL